MGNAAIGQRRGWGRRVVALPARRSLLLLGFGVVVIVGLWATVPAQDAPERLTQLGLALAAIAGVAVAGRWPVIAVAMTTIATGAAWAVGLTADPFLLTGITLFAIAEKRGERRFPVWMMVGAVVVGVGSLVLGSDGFEDRFRGLLLGTIVAATAWALGVRTRAVRIEVEERARAEERLHLAREVHDILSHSLGSIGVRAGVAAHVSSLGEPALRDVLRDVEKDARSSLAELGDVLERTRATDAASNRVAPPFSEAVADLVRTGEGAGIRTRADVEGDVDALPPVVSTTALRIAQEAVTNAIRHSGASTLSIAVRVGSDRLEVIVTDDGVGLPSNALDGVGLASEARSGFGLIGMQERVDLLGGTLERPPTERGAVIRVTLPLRSSPVAAIVERSIDGSLT